MKILDNIKNIFRDKVRINFIYSNTEERELLKKNIEKELEGKPQVSITKEYRDLAPFKDIANNNEYINALDWALENHRIKNIALTGPYGSGKSSIIDTYLQHNKNNDNLVERSIKISMANFEVNDPQKITIDANEVEEGILKQLFYKVQNKKIPMSRYRKLYVKNFKDIFLKSSGILLFTLFILAIFFPDKYTFLSSSIESFVNNKELLDSYPAIFLIFFCPFVTFFLWVILFLLTSYSISYLWYWGASKYFLKEIKILSEAKIEANSDNSASVFNKNLDEIMYFFEATKYRIVFFEDLDRLNDKKIFVHLRELNILLNNDDNIKEKPIVFIYAVKDDIFTKYDRTKFFDFIIPVIPIINSTNSGEILLERLQETKDDEVKNNISEEFVFDVSPFISDMRMLQNIYNEFIIYKNTIKDAQGLSLSEEQMMAMIIFKNLCPNDFADIQAEKGIIKKAFENKNFYIKEKKDELQKKIDSFETIVKEAKSDSLNSIKELKFVMLFELVESRGYFKCFKWDHWNKTEILDVLSDAFDMNSLKNYNNCNIEYFDYDGRRYDNIYIKNFQDKILPYIKRWKSLKTLEEENLKRLREENECRKQKYQKLSGQSLTTIIAENEDFKFDDEVSKNKLLVFLLRRGYIDEKYANYINYFKGNSITTADMNFILSIKNQEAKAFDYSLTKTSAIVKRLQYYEFAQKEIYNFDLLEYMLSSNVENEKLEIFLKQLSDETKISWDFIDIFFDRTTDQQMFINRLADIWPGIWDFILKQTSLSYDRQLQYLIHIINSGQTMVEKCNKNDSIKNYIESHSDILQKLLQYVSIEQLCLVIEKLNIIFKNQEINGVKSEVLDYIFDGNYYDLNEKMISNIVSYRKKELLDDLGTKPYTTIMNLEDDNLKYYIWGSFEYYLSNNIFAKEGLNDDICDIEDMIGRVITKVEYCSEIIKCEQIKISDIKKFLANKIDNYKETVHIIYDALLINDKVIPSWENIVVYWEYFSFTECLTEYISTNVEVLKTADKQFCSDSFIEAFIRANCDDSVYRNLLPIMHMENFNIDLNKLPEKMLQLMIEIKYFEFTLERYACLEKIEHNMAVNYIVNNQNIAINQIEKIDMSKNLFEELLNNQFFDYKNKEILCNLFAEKYMSIDIINFILYTKTNINKSCFMRAWGLATIELKEQLFMAYFDLLNVSDLEKCFAELGEKYNNFKIRSKSHIAKLVYNEGNLRLANYLKEIEYITSYRLIENTDKHSSDQYVAISCRIKKVGK